jgi:hypothetical protein
MAYSQEQARDENGRFASGGAGPSQARAERVALNTRLDARNRSLPPTHDFGPAARVTRGSPPLPTGAHTSAIEQATAGKSLDAKNAANLSQFTLAQLSARGATTAKVGGAS